MLMKHNEFWAFMVERENIRRRRLSGMPREQWTQDPIFKEYSFTNVKRIHDRTTQLFIREFYDKVRGKYQHPSQVALMNAAVYRYHGTIETARIFGWMDWWNRDHIVRKNEIRMLMGEQVFTPAYVIPNCGSTEAKHIVVADIITGIINSADMVLNTTKWETACQLLCRNWGVGSFMAKEVLLDYMLITEWIPDDWETWTPIGPGGRLGAGIVRSGKLSKIPDSEAIYIIRSLYGMRHDRWPDLFPKLDLTDIQFQLCEFAKYMKAKEGGRPKRKFRPTIDSITSLIT